MQDQDQDQSSSLSFCPSFNCYSTDRLAEIATKVSKEEEEEEAGTFPEEQSDGVSREDEEDFEFVLVRANPDGYVLPIDGGAGEVFPLFNRDLLFGGHEEEEGEGGGAGAVAVEDIRLPLKKLFIDDRDPLSPSSSSSSSSEADELEVIPEGTYCVWTPKSPPPSPERCQKSNSTGSSFSKPQRRQWRLRDFFLRRCRSEGKDSFVFLDQNNGKELEKGVNKGKTVKEKVVNGGSKSNNGKEKLSAAHEAFYVRSKATKDGEKRRRSYLPYRQDLVGLFASVSASGRMGRTFPPFS